MHLQSAHAHVNAPFCYLANSWTDCVHILYVASPRDPLDKSFAQVRGGVHLYVRTCTPLFHISRKAWRIVLKFGARLGTHSMSLAQVRYGAHLHVSTCKPFRMRCPRGRSFIADQGALLVVTTQVVFLIITIALKARMNSVKAELKFNFGFNPRTAGAHLCPSHVAFSQIA